MKQFVLTGTVKIWFGLLKMALRQHLPINEDFYRSWGTKDELLKMTFNRWWKTKGKTLFESTIPKVSLVEATHDLVTVQIPTSLTAVQVKEQVSDLMTKHRGTKRLKKKPLLAFTGDVNYKRLKQYERYLGIELNPRNAGKTVEEKTELLREEYRKIKARMDKQKATLREKGKGRISAKLNPRDPDSFGSKAEIRRGIDAKKVSRWRLSGKILVLNAAEGRFPGRDYYGAQLAKKLQMRLERLGLPDIGGTARNKGGGRRKEELTLVRITKSNADREAQSLMAYGKSKGSNPVGNGNE
jgi:hypothetical protein